MSLRRDMDAALLAQLREVYAGDLPPWLQAELAHDRGEVPAQAADACRAAVQGDTILRLFAERLAPVMPPTQCARSLLARELLLAAALPAEPQPGCLVRELGCGGPCGLRCHTHLSHEARALVRQAIRYVAVSYDFGAEGDIAADKITAVKRRELPRQPLERKSPS